MRDRETILTRTISSGDYRCASAIINRKQRPCLNFSSNSNNLEVPGFDDGLASLVDIEFLVNALKMPLDGGY